MERMKTIYESILSSTKAGTAYFPKVEELYKIDLPFANNMHSKIEYGAKLEWFFDFEKMKQYAKQHHLKENKNITTLFKCILKSIHVPSGINNHYNAFFMIEKELQPLLKDGCKICDPGPDDFYLDGFSMYGKYIRTKYRKEVSEHFLIFSLDEL